MPYLIATKGSFLQALREAKRHYSNSRKPLNHNLHEYIQLRQLHVLRLDQPIRYNSLQSRTLRISQALMYCLHELPVRYEDSALHFFKCSTFYLQKYMMRTIFKKSRYTREDNPLHISERLGSHGYLIDAHRCSTYHIKMVGSWGLERVHKGEKSLHKPFLIMPSCLSE